MLQSWEGNSKLTFTFCKELYILPEMETQQTFLLYVSNAKKIKELFHPT